MRLKIENQKFFFNLVNKGHKVDIFNKEISSIDFFCSRRERVKGLPIYTPIHKQSRRGGKEISI